MTIAPRIPTSLTIRPGVQQPLPRHRFERLQLGVVVRRPDVLDLPRPTTGGGHDLHRPGP
ncbi:hypothetical protein [Sphaerimonospora thailandensis]|uniref:hypothetical protein n=1 Tax=Sphaerimonospora thailandensis TaxID=795644 RepID=UPI0019524E6A|nr:hypothetical protein [Sphaerimonospora thailandensis]